MQLVCQLSVCCCCSAGGGCLCVPGECLAHNASVSQSAPHSTAVETSPAHGGASCCQCFNTPTFMLRVPHLHVCSRCHYTGRLASNGRVFDSSYERRRPLSFKIGVREVIAGWDMGILGTEGVPPMKEGGKRWVWLYVV